MWANVISLKRYTVIGRRHKCRLFNFFKTFCPLPLIFRSIIISFFRCIQTRNAILTMLILQNKIIVQSFVLFREIFVLLLTKKSALFSQISQLMIRSAMKGTGWSQTRIVLATSTQWISSTLVIPVISKRFVASSFQVTPPPPPYIKTPKLYWRKWDTIC